jgi:hypothetical protein
VLSHASLFDQICSFPHAGHVIDAGVFGKRSKLTWSVSIPTGTSRPVVGHLIMMSVIVRPPLDEVEETKVHPTK